MIEVLLSQTVYFPNWDDIRVNDLVKSRDGLFFRIIHIEEEYATLIIDYQKTVISDREQSRLKGLILERRESKSRLLLLYDFVCDEEVIRSINKKH